MGPSAAHASSLNHSAKRVRPSRNRCAAAVPQIPAQIQARHELYGTKMQDGSNSGSVVTVTDELYASYLALRSMPAAAFLAGKPNMAALPITSVSEDKLLVILGLPRDERNQIEGLKAARLASGLVRSGFGFSEEQLSTLAIARLTTDPPAMVGTLQRKTRCWLLRPFPLGYAAAAQARDVAGSTPARIH